MRPGRGGSRTPPRSTTNCLLCAPQETYTDYDELVAQYAAFYLRLGPESIKQALLV